MRLNRSMIVMLRLQLKKLVTSMEIRKGLLGQGVLTATRWTMNAHTQTHTVPLAMNDAYQFSIISSSRIIGEGRSERRPNGIYRGQWSLEESSECAGRGRFRSNTRADSQVFHRFVAA